MGVVLKMIYLSLSALKYAANICEELPKYKVGIAIPHSIYSERLINIISTHIEDTGVKIVKSVYNAKIEFSNGSSIRFIDASDNSRGITLNLLIVDYSINRAIIDNMLIPCERDDYYKKYNTEDKI